MKYELVTTARFRKDVKRMKKQGLPMRELSLVLEELLEGRALPQAYQDHGLSGNYSGFRECHIRPDWLLIYIVDGNNLRASLKTSSFSFTP